jgi:uncharacterized protein (DUF1697 family)
MATYIVLLRGVMPSGKNKVPMAHLREVLGHAGFGHVRTYIQSGNVLLDTDHPAFETQNRVHDLIREHIGPDLAVVVRTGTEVQTILANNPFHDGYDLSRVFFVLFAQMPRAEAVRELLTEDFGEEKLAIATDAAYMYIPGMYGRGRLSNNFLEKKLHISATMRNFNTLSTLVEMAKA